MKPRFKLSILVNNQEEKDIVSKIFEKIEMYEKYNFSEGGFPHYIVNNLGEVPGAWSDTSTKKGNTRGRTVIDQWNEPLLQALLSATEGDDFTVGEWVKAEKSSYYSFTEDKLYKIRTLNDSAGNIGIEIDDNGSKTNGWISSMWAKPTIEELKQHFLNMKEDKELIGYELLKDFYGLHKGYTFTIHNKGATISMNERCGIKLNYEITKEALSDTSIFKPVYKEVIKEVVRTIKPEVGSDITLKITKGGIIAIPGDSPEYIWDKEDIKEFKRLLLSVVFKGWSIISNTVDIGCRKGIKVSDLQECIDIYDKMQK